MQKTLKKTALRVACLVAMTGLAESALAANWLMLQGTEPSDAAPRAKVWGFVQAQYQKDFSDPNPSDQYIPPKLIGPDLTSQQQFNVNRARIGVRGTGFPLDSKVNYFLLAEFGNNAITRGNGASTHVTDASITLNHIPGARVRVGLFKTPGFEEGFQAIHVFDYINLTTVGNQLMLERLPNSTYTANAAATTLPVDTSNGGLNRFERPVAAFRDVGVQVFDTFTVKDWEHSYAVMLGNGNGLNSGDVDNNKDLYLYWSSEKVFGGKGPRREGLKFFAWSQNGKRLLDNTDDATHNPTKFDRKRSGVGVKYLKAPWRFTAEYLKGEGMIFVGPDKPTFDQNGPGSPAADGADGKGSGWYLDGGWYIPNTKWELDLRYDVYNRLEDDPGPPGGPNAGKSFESEWKTITLGTQYHFNKKTHLTVNYAIRNVETPAFGSGAGPNANMDDVGNVAAVQITHVF